MFDIKHFFIESIYGKLGIKKVIVNNLQESKINFDLNNILKLLVFNRIINPSSKKNASEKQDLYFNEFNTKLRDVYRSLSHLSKISDLIQKEMHKNIVKKYNRKCSLVLYDVTNYYFEIEKEDKLKRKGVSKEKRQSPIVQMGLLIDENKIPIAYEIFPGNTHDTTTFIQMINKIKDKFGIGDVVVVADNSYYAFSYISDNLNKLLKAFNVKIEYVYEPIEDIRRLKKICIYK